MKDRRFPLRLLGRLLFFDFGRIFGARLSGLIAWLVWAFIHITYLVNFQSRILVFIQWAIQDLTFSRGARLITGAAPTDFDFTKELSDVRAARKS